MEGIDDPYNLEGTTISNSLSKIIESIWMSIGRFWLFLLDTLVFRIDKGIRFTWGFEGCLLLCSILLEACSILLQTSSQKLFLKNMFSIILWFIKYI